MMLENEGLLASGDAQEAERWLAEQFGLHGTLTPWRGADGSFKVTAADGSAYHFKIHPPAADAQADLQAAALRYLEQHAPDLPLPRLYLGLEGHALPVVTDATGAQRRLRLATWPNGMLWAEAPRRGAHAAAALGRLLARLDRSLAGFHHPAATQPCAWDIANAAARRDAAALIDDPERRAAVLAILHRFVLEVAPRLGALPRQVIQCAADARNIVLDGAGAAAGLIDCDLVETWRINGLAAAAADLAVGAADPLAAILPLVEAYAAENAIGALEAEALLDLVLTRLAVRLALAARQKSAQPEGVWTALQALQGLNRALSVARLRRAAGLEPVAERRAIELWILRNGRGFGPIMPVPLDRESLRLLPLGADCDPSRRRPFREALHDALAVIDGTAVGRYGEDRAIYDAETAGERRTLHHAIDVYAPAGTPVLAPMPGRIAMLGDDTSADGFGGIVVLEHEPGTPHRFWTFYGHLAPASLAGHAIGARVEQGDAIGRLGRPAENGDWPPHVHMQLMTALAFDRAEAIIGLSLRSEWDLWESIFPNPNGILGLPVETGAIVARDPHPRLSAEASPELVRAEGADHIAGDRRRCLDMANDACPVGDAHPRVVAAIARQAARRGGDTRTLRDTQVEFTARLARLLPPELSAIFLANSGSEANDLALRLAKAHTGGTEVMVLDHACHGHLSSLIDISPYAFDDKGGAGRPRHTWVTEMPDLYRGRFRAGDADAGARYAEKIATLLRDMGGINRRLAAFFVEPILGSGGRMALPGGYLEAAFEEVRAAGGICIADEVNLAIGRTGSHLWAFETQGVIPDIVTMGEGLGNGHPIGAVACRPEIAAALQNATSGNPVSAAAGLAVLDIIRDERLMPNAAAMGAHLRAGLGELAERHAIIGDVRGLGLFLGVELVRDRETREPAAAELQAIVEAMRGEGIVLGVAGPRRNVLKIDPPLVIAPADCEFFLETLAAVLARLRH